MTLTLDRTATGAGNNIAPIVMQNIPGDLRTATLTDAKYFYVDSGVVGIQVDGPPITNTVPNGPAVTQHRWYTPFRCIVDYRASDVFPPGNPNGLGAPQNVYHGIESIVLYGQNNSNPIGTVHAFSGNVHVKSSGDGGSEPCVWFGNMTAEGNSNQRFWFTDFGLQGPAAQRPRLLNGVTMVVNNHSVETPSDGPAACFWGVGGKGNAGPGNDIVGGTCIATDVGYGAVGGESGVGGNRGFTRAFQAGGYGSGWMNAALRSRIGTGLYITDTDLAAIDIDGVISVSGAAPSGLYSAQAGQIRWGGDSGIWRSAANRLFTDADLDFLTGKGPMIKSPDGTRYRIIVANGGVLSTLAVA